MLSQIFDYRTPPRTELFRLTLSNCAGSALLFPSGIYLRYSLHSRHPFPAICSMGSRRKDWTSTLGPSSISLRSGRSNSAKDPDTSAAGSVQEQSKPKKGESLIYITILSGFKAGYIGRNSRKRAGSEIAVDNEVPKSTGKAKRARSGTGMFTLHSAT